jgi:chromosome partitioning protein
MLIAIANSKGGVGKSTLSVHLAAWLHGRGKSVILADCDMQQSSSDWIREAAPDVRTAVFKDADAILHEFPMLGQEAEYVIADGPGSNSESSRSLLLRADYAIVPCKASMLEVRALAKVTDAVRIAQDVRQGPPPAIVVLSMVRESYRLTQDMKDAAAALSLRVAQTPVTLRQVFADSPGQGQVVWTMGSRGRDAAAEIDALFHEVMADIHSMKPAIATAGR